MADEMRCADESNLPAFPPAVACGQNGSRGSGGQIRCPVAGPLLTIWAITCRPPTRENTKLRRAVRPLMLCPLDILGSTISCLVDFSWNNAPEPGVSRSNPMEINYVDLLFRHHCRSGYWSKRRGHHAAGGERTEIPPLGLRQDKRDRGAVFGPPLLPVRLIPCPSLR
jgi:hypothetical protein